MLASCPVSTVNQNAPDSGIPTDSAQRHPALRRVAVRLPNGAEVRVPRPAGRERLSGEMPIVPEMGADTNRIRREFGI